MAGTIPMTNRRLLYRQGSKLSYSKVMNLLLVTLLQVTSTCGFTSRSRPFRREGTLSDSERLNGRLRLPENSNDPSVRLKALGDNFETDLAKIAPHLTTGSTLAFPAMLLPHVFGEQGPMAILASTASAVDRATGSFLLSQILTDASHVVLDLTTFWGPSALAMRLGAVAGRLMVMAADYLPDHFMTPEEIVFQFFMLSVAWAGLVKTALPLLLSNLHTDIAIKDGRAYLQLFEPAGIHWNQFKALKLYALDWTDVSPGEKITSDEESEGGQGDPYIYWLFEGNVKVTTKDKVVQNLTRTTRLPSSKETTGTEFLIGEMDFILQLESRRKKQSRGLSRRSYPQTTAFAGEQGATLLRIHKSNLSLLMESDHDLEHSIRTLLLHCVHDKLALQLQSV